MLYGKAECPVCADSGSLICLKAVRTGVLFFYCPLCGVAFRELPSPPTALEEILSLEQLAPGGAVLPDRNEIEASGVEMEEIDDHPWSGFLTPLLASE